MSKTKKTQKSTGSITSRVMILFKRNPKIKSAEMIQLIKEDFPKSKFNVYHYSWFKYQIKKGRYQKLFDKKQYQAIFSGTKKKSKKPVEVEVEE